MWHISTFSRFWNIDMSTMSVLEKIIHDQSHTSHPCTSVLTMSWHMTTDVELSRVSHQHANAFYIHHFWARVSSLYRIPIEWTVCDLSLSFTSTLNTQAHAYLFPQNPKKIIPLLKYSFHSNTKN